MSSRKKYLRELWANTRKITDTYVKALDGLSKSIHKVNVDKGFWENPNDLTTQKMLITSEAYEAFEAVRGGLRCEEELSDLAKMSSLKNEWFVPLFKARVKDTVEDEIADVFIRLLDWAGHLMVNFKDLPYFCENITYHFGENIVHDIDNLVTVIREDFESVNAPLLKSAIINSLIAVIQFCKAHNIDLITHAFLKVEYNKSRGYKHGKKF